MKKSGKKLRNIIFLIIGIIVVIFVALVAYLVVKDLEQEDLLKQEIVNVSNKDLLTDNFDVEVKTTGDYAYVEEAVKTYYKQLSDSVKVINSYLNDEELINILSAQNIAADGPKFKNSYQILETTKIKSTEAIQKIADLCEEDTIKNLIDKEKVDDYYYDLYKELMYTKEDLKSLQETKQKAEKLSVDLNLFLDKVKEMLNMLEKNSNNWEIKDNKIYFDKDSLVDEYNNLYNELNKISTEKFTVSNQTTNKTNV